MSFLDSEESILGIKSRVLSKSAGNNQKGLSEAVDTELGLSRNFSLSVLHEVLMGSDFERSSTGEDGLIFDSVRDSTHSISDSILGLSDGVIVRSLNGDGARERVLNTFNESVFIISESLL